MVSVVPLNDDREHCLAVDCWCEPTVEWIDKETGRPYPNGPLVIHNRANDGGPWATYRS